MIGATGCVARSPVAHRDDATITGEARARLAADEQTKPFAITVTTTAGVVHVTGAVETSADRDAVERVVRATPGVRTVDNNVRFGAAQAPVEDSP